MCVCVCGWCGAVGGVCGGGGGGEWVALVRRWEKSMSILWPYRFFWISSRSVMSDFFQNFLTATVD